MPTASGSVVVKTPRLMTVLTPFMKALLSRELIRATRTSSEAWDATITPVLAFSSLRSRAVTSPRPTASRFESPWFTIRVFSRLTSAQAEIPCPPSAVPIAETTCTSVFRRHVYGPPPATAIPVRRPKP
jgi:hypothetical protein